VGLGELWSYRELLFFLVWRDVKVRYRQTVLGASWAVIRPFFTMVVFSVIFGRLARIPSEGLPYPIFAYTALVPWTYFSTALTAATNVLVGHRGVITRVYFPRLILPASAVLAALVDMAIAFVVLVAMMLFYKIMPTLAILTIPLFLLLAMVTALGVGLWLSALNAIYRDVGHGVSFLVQVWLFASPVAYPSSLIPGPWRLVYGLNPMAGVIEGFRWALLGTGQVDGAMLGVSAAVSAVVLISGLLFFRRLEKTFADVV
jgi:lipopolysaccharide transport system permease protein